MAHRLWVRHLIDLSNGHTKTLQKIDIEITEVIIFFEGVEGVSRSWRGKTPMATITFNECTPFDIISAWDLCGKNNKNCSNSLEFGYKGNPLWSALIHVAFAPSTLSASFHQPLSPSQVSPMCRAERSQGHIRCKPRHLMGCQAKGHLWALQIHKPAHLKCKSALMTACYLYNKGAKNLYESGQA